MERVAEKKEYSFAAGVEQIVTTVEALLVGQHYVVVAIAGPLVHDTNVGKTFLAGTITERLQQQNIPYLTASDDMTLAHKQPHQMDHGVVILGAMGSPSQMTEQAAVIEYGLLQDAKVKATAASIGLPISKIDLHVLICKPGSSVSPADRMYNDIIIRNDEATNKITG